MQPGRSWRGVVTMVTASAVALAVTGNAQADGKRISDGNDRPGPLDIRSASHGHAGSRVVHTISTFNRWRLSDLGPDTRGLFAVEISSDGDRALERVVLIFRRGGQIIARVYRISGRRLISLGSGSASKPDGRTVRVSFARSLIGTTAGYRWKAHSQHRAAGRCNNLCVDHAPNSGLILHDITAPTIVMRSFPAIPPDVEYDVSFRVSDAGGAGLRRWQLQHRLLGTPGWTTIATGTTVGLKSHHRVSAENENDEFRVVAVDRQGNKRTSPVRLVSVPFDDASASLAYMGAWTHGVGDPSDFRDTLSSSATPSDTVTLTFTGRYVAWVAPGGGGATAMVEIDGAASEEVILDGTSGRRRVVYERTLPSVATRSITIEVVSGTVPIDGIIVR
jgi:hypothetical protein